MKNIVVICFKYPPLYSGYGRQLKSIIDNIEKNSEVKLNITILTAYIESEYHSKNINVIPLLHKNDNNSKSVYRFSRKVLLWLYQERNNYSIIHCIKAGPEAIVSNIISKVYSKKLMIKIAQDELSDR